MIDYKEEMIKLFSRYYSPMGEDWNKKHMSTTEIDFLFRGIFPSLPVSEHDIYEIMKEMGYYDELVTYYEKVCTFKGDEKEGIPPEYEDQEAGKVFKWVVFEIG